MVELAELEELVGLTKRWRYIVCLGMLSITIYLSTNQQKQLWHDPGRDYPYRVLESRKG